MIRLGSCHWDPQKKILFADGQPLRLPRRAAECLALLLQASGEVVTKEHLQDQLWQGRAVEESNLAQCISALRKVLGADSIETVVGIGYRFTLLPTAAPPAPLKRFPRFALALLLVLLIAAAYFVYPRSASRRAEADQLYQQGIALVRAGNLAKGMQANTYFERALAIDPNHALSYAGLAEAAARFAKGSTNASLPLAEKAVRLDPSCGECQAILGYVNLTREWNWAAAGQALERALAIDPRPTQWILWRAQWLATQRRLPEAQSLLESALAQDPSKANLQTMLAGVHYLAGHTQAAIAAAERAISINPSLAAPYLWLYRIHWVAGNYEDAVLAHTLESVRWGAANSEQEQAMRDEEMSHFRQHGISGVCDRWLERFGHGMAADINRCERALWQLRQGRPSEALTELELAVQSRPFHLIYVASDPAYASLHSSPRFQQLLRKLQLPATYTGQ